MLKATRRWLPHAVFLVGAVVIVVGHLLDAGGTLLYVPNPPFLWRGDFGVDPLVVVAGLIAVGAVLVVPRLLRAPSGAFLVGLLVLTGLIRLSFSAARGGTGSWDQVFDPARSFEAANEYIPALPALRYGVDIFLDRFAEVVTALPVHAAGHPPGLLLTMYGLGIETPAALATLCIAAAIATVPAAYALGCRVLDEPQARIAALLLALSPGATMFGVTSPDAVYALLGVLAALALMARPRVLGWGLGAVTLAVSTIFAWSLLAIGAWAALLELRREGWRRALGLSVVCGVVLIGGYALFYAWTGFDPIGTVRGTETVYRAGIAQGRPYWFWLLGSPTAFLFTLGLPIAWYGLRGLSEGRSVAVAIFAVLVIASLLGFTKAETERIWLFFGPFVCLAAATVLPRERMPLVAGLLVAQGLAFELMVDSVW